MQIRRQHIDTHMDTQTGLEATQHVTRIDQWSRLVGGMAASGGFVGMELRVWDGPAWAQQP